MFFLSVVITSYAQHSTNDTVGNVYFVSVNDSSLIDVLDFIDNELNQCVFYNLQFDYFFLCYFQEKKIKIMAIPYNKITDYFLQGIACFARTFFYYKGKLVIALDMGSPFFNKIFTLSDWPSTLSFQNVNENRPSVELGFDCCWVNCVYDINGCINIDYCHPCHYRHYHYVVQNGDSWEIIAFRIGTTKEILQSMLGRDYFVSPQKGDILEISYEIEQRDLKIASLRFRHFHSDDESSPFPK